MRIPRTEPAAAREPQAAQSAESQPRSEPVSEPQETPFKLSPLEPRPTFHSPQPALDRAENLVAPGPSAAHGAAFATAAGPQEPDAHHHGGTHQARFELLDDDADPALLQPVSPQIARGLREIAEFESDRSGYTLADERHGFFSRLEHSRPAGWLYVQWRACVGLVLKVLRWVDAWAYLISVPFVVLMLFGIVVANRGLVHLGAVVIVLANYGRFWADLIAFFVRPYKDGPLQGIAFLFPPYTAYYLIAHWDRMKPIVRRIATSCIPIIMVVLAYAFLPTVNPSAKDVRGLGAKIEAGEQELAREIDSDLRQVENRVESLGKPRQSALERNPKNR
jgi:hypothetical protein